jgi:hypothetical protein
MADVDPSIRVSPFSKAPSMQMVLGVVGSSGQKCPIVFVGTGKEVYVDVYQDLLRQHMVPWVQRTYPDGNYVFQQDSAPAHIVPTTHAFLRENMADFWALADWLLYSPDLNLLDFSMWSV